MTAEPRHDGGDEPLFDAVLLPERLERTVAAEQVAAEGGLTVDEVGDLMEAFGLPRPRPGEAAFTPAEAHALIELGRLGDLWPDEARIAVGRLYGAALASIARAELQAFQSFTHDRVAGDEGTAEHLEALRAVLERLLPLADPLVVGVHRRWVEHELGQRAVAAAEREADGDGVPGTVDVTFLFCDLKDFTAYAEAQGDGAAIAAIDAFFAVVGRERGTESELVKSLGDGALLAYGNACDAVAAGARVIAAMREAGGPEVHASVHRGPAVARFGDYLGGSVNLAARLLALSSAGELVATEIVVETCGERFTWTPAGEARLRGVAEPVAVYLLS